MNGFIKIYRDQLHMEALQGHSALFLWIFLNDQIRFRQAIQDGVDVQPGQVLITADQIAQHCDLTIRQVRYLLDRFVQEGLIRMQNIRNRHTLITVLSPEETQRIQQNNQKNTILSEDICEQPQADPVQQNHFLPEEESAQRQEQPTQQIPVLSDPCYEMPQEQPVQADVPVQEEYPKKQPKPRYVPVLSEAEISAMKNPTPKAAVPEEPSTEEPNANAPKHICGICRNVYLTDEEKRILQERSSIANLYIDNLSAYKRRTNKQYADDFSVLCEWICKDEINAANNAAMRPAQPQRDKEYTYKKGYEKQSWETAPASYDLELAERMARESVPVLRKRRPR